MKYPKTKISTVILGVMVSLLAVPVAAQTLYGFYNGKLPSLKQRAVIANQAGIENYHGTAKQNNQLLAFLGGGALGTNFFFPQGVGASSNNTFTGTNSFTLATLFADGTTTAPGVAFINSTGTGLSRNSTSGTLYLSVNPAIPPGSIAYSLYNATNDILDISASGTQIMPNGQALMFLQANGTRPATAQVGFSSSNELQFVNNSTASSPNIKFIDGNDTGIIGFYTGSGQTEAMRIAQGGLIGVNNATPTYRFDLINTDTSTAAGTSAALKATNNPLPSVSTTTARNYISIVGAINFDPNDTSTYTGVVAPVYSSPDTKNANITLTNFGGFYSNPNARSGSTITNFYGYDGQFGLGSGGAIITNAESFWVPDENFAGTTTTNAYGLRIGTVLGATNNWGIGDFSAQRFFKGSTVFGSSSTPAYTIDDQGTLNVTGTTTLSTTTIQGLTIGTGRDGLTSNTALGLNALAGANSGVGLNVAIGDAALNANTSGTHNTSVGGFSLNVNTTGNNNSAFGYDALLANTSGNDNTAIGYGALAGNSLGRQNVGIGEGSLNNNQTGSSSVAIGYNAGYYETSSNAFYVDNQDRGNTAGDKANALFYGTFAAAAANQTLNINASTTVNGNLTVVNTTTLSGIQENTAAEANVCIDASGQLYKDSSLACLTSNPNLKDNIKSLTGNSLDIVNALQPIEWDWKPGVGRTGHDLGFNAEQAAKVDSLLVVNNPDGTVKGFKYQEFTARLTNAVQELNKKVDTQQKEIDDLKTAIVKMGGQVEKHESLIAKLIHWVKSL